MVVKVSAIVVRTLTTEMCVNEKSLAKLIRNLVSLKNFIYSTADGVSQIKNYNSLKLIRNNYIN